MRSRTPPPTKTPPAPKVTGPRWSPAPELSETGAGNGGHGAGPPCCGPCTRSTWGPRGSTQKRTRHLITRPPQKKTRDTRDSCNADSLLLSQLPKAVKHVHDVPDPPRSLFYFGGQVNAGHRHVLKRKHRNTRVCSGAHRLQQLPGQREGARREPTRPALGAPNKPSGQRSAGKGRNPAREQSGQTTSAVSSNTFLWGGSPGGAPHLHGMLHKGLGVKEPLEQHLPSSHSHLEKTKGALALNAHNSRSSRGSQQSLKKKDTSSTSTESLRVRGLASLTTCGGPGTAKRWARPGPGRGQRRAGLTTNKGPGRLLLRPRGGYLVPRPPGAPSPAADGAGCRLPG